MHPCGVGGIEFLWMLIIEEDPGRTRGLTCLKKPGMWKCEALEELSSVVCTLEALEEFAFFRCKSLMMLPN